MGARIVERHFTYDKSAPGPDHMLSADPAEMKWLVNAIREFEVLRGNGIKRPAKSEQSTRINNRKSLVINADVVAGDRITKEVLTIKRPGDGIEPKYYEQILGRGVIRDLDADSVLKWGDLI